MKARSGARLAWFLGALTLAMFVAYVALALSRRPGSPPPSIRSSSNVCSATSPFWSLPRWAC